MLRFAKNSFIFLALLLISESLLAAQSVTFRGNVLDGRQTAVLGGAEVVVKAGADVVAQVQTEPEGTFNIPLEPGHYTVEITAGGFDKIVRTVSLTPNLESQSFLMNPAETSPDGVQEMADDDQQMEDYLVDLAGTGRSASSGDVIFDLLLSAPVPSPHGLGISGTVVDDQQTAVIGAQVVVKLGTRIVAEVQTGFNGTFNIPLQAGMYTVEVSAAGFDKALQNVNLSGDLAPLSFLLKVQR